MKNPEITDEELAVLLEGHELPEDRMAALNADPESLDLVNLHHGLRILFEDEGSEEVCSRSTVEEPEEQPVLQEVETPVEAPASGGVRNLPLVAVILAAVGVIAGAFAWFSFRSPDYTMGHADRLAVTQDWLLGGAVAGGGAILIVWLAMRALKKLHLPVMSYALGGTACFVVLTVVSYGFASSKETELRGEIDSVLSAHRWCAYESPNLDRYPETHSFPTKAQIEKELRQIHKGGKGFDGLITFDSEGGALDQVPRIAREVGFKAVILGVYLSEKDRDNPGEIKRKLDAAAGLSADVDAYCVGQNTPGTVTLTDLRGWMAELRRSTGKPVTTSFSLYAYLGPRGRELRSLGDFLFPDCVGPWQEGATPQKAAEHLRGLLRDVQSLPPERSVLLKMVSYPSAGGEGLSEATQARFFRGVFRDLLLPKRVYLSVFNSHDLPWKSRHPEDWSPAEEHVGLVRLDGTEKPALQVILKHWRIGGDR